MSHSITDQLITFSKVEVPPDTAHMMRLSLYDWAACGIAGAASVEYDEFKAAQIALHPGVHCVLGNGRASATTAALVNGTLSHALDYDDTHFAHIGHPSVAVVPAVLSVAEHSGANLKTCVDAAATGVEASILVGLWLGREHYQVGYHQTATAGAFGATVGACRLLSLSPQQTRHALGLCASMASGIKAQFGTMSKPLNAGLAARTGVEAALWAQSGMTAAHDGLAGPLGFGATHHGERTDIQVSQDSWHILSISHKYHACCHGLHAMLEALCEANVNGADVRKLHIYTHQRWMSVCNIQAPQTGLAAKFSYTQTAAMTLAGCDTRSIGSFTDQVAQDAHLAELRSRITVSEDAGLTETQCKIVVTHNDGTTQNLHHDLLTPIGVDTRIEKLRAKAESLIGASQAETLWRSTLGNSLSEFTGCLSEPSV